MVNYMEELSVTEAENLKKTISALFRQTCILQVKYDPVTLTPRDNLHYEICVRHRKFIEDYLAVLGCELVHDPQEHIFRLTGEGVAVERLNVTTTKIILLIKMIYRDKILGEGLNATVTNLAEIREYGKNTNLINEKLTMAEWKDALYMMSKHQIIEVPGAIQNVEDQTKIYIYSTINLYCSGVDIQALMREYVDELDNTDFEENVNASEQMPEYGTDSVEKADANEQMFEYNADFEENASEQMSEYDTDSEENVNASEQISEYNTDSEKYEDMSLDIESEEGGAEVEAGEEDIYKNADE